MEYRQMEKLVRAMAKKLNHTATDSDYTVAKRQINFKADGNNKVYEYGIGLWCRLTGY